MKNLYLALKNLTFSRKCYNFNFLNVILINKFAATSSAKSESDAAGDGAVVISQLISLNQKSYASHRVVVVGKIWTIRFGLGGVY